MAKETVFPPSPPTSRPPVLLSAPFAFGTEGTDLLRVRLWCFAPRAWPSAGRLFNLVIRSVTPDGVGQLTVVPIVPTTDLLKTEVLVPLAAGALQTISLTWAGTGLTSTPGLCYGLVDLIRGTTSGAQIAIGALLSGYLGPGLGLTWPGSPLEDPQSGPGFQWSITFAGFPGTEVNIAAIAGLVLRVRSVFLDFTAGAAVASRRPHLFARILAADLGYWPTPQPVTASTHFWCTWMPGAPLTVGNPDLSGVAPMPDGLILRDGDSIRTTTIGLQPADNYSTIVLNWDAWIDPL